MCILAWSLSEKAICLVGLQCLCLQLFSLLLGHYLKMPYVWSTLIARAVNAGCIRMLLCKHNCFHGLRYFGYLSSAKQNWCSCEPTITLVSGWVVLYYCYIIIRYA
jgi:hypothetical protein